LLLLNEQMIDCEHMEEDLTKHMEGERAKQTLLVAQVTEASRE
jgi:hypothetical protein